MTADEAGPLYSMIANRPFAIQVTVSMSGPPERQRADYAIQVLFEEMKSGQVALTLPPQVVRCPPSEAVSATLSVPAGLAVGLYRVCCVATPVEEPASDRAGYSSELVLASVRDNSDTRPTSSPHERDETRDRYRALIRAKHLGRITPGESAELAELDRALTFEAEQDAREFEARYPESRATRLEAGLRKVDELLAELRRARDAG